MESIEEDGVNISSKLPGQLLQVHRLRTECSDLKERAAALKLEKMRLEKEVEKQERELEAVNQPTFDNLRFEEMSSLVNNGGPKMGQSISVSLTDLYLRMRTELHRLKEVLEEEEEVVDKIQVKELELESLTEALVKSKKMASELRVCYVSSVTHQQEVELKAELKELVEARQREKVEMEDELSLEKERVAKLAIDAQEDEEN